jgi:3-hydroxybutyryl-CoA dehydrogenase
MNIECVFIAGAGAMGSGIAQVCAQAGMTVIVSDPNEASLTKAMKQIDWSVGKMVEKGKCKEDKSSVLGRIQTAADLSRAEQGDLVIEAVFEDRQIKQELFKELDARCKPGAVIASNTSAIPITELASVTARPEDVVGIHFFNPVPIMPAVEIVRGILTAEATMKTGVEFVSTLGKTPIRVESDMPGFLLNRINLVGYVEAIRLLEKGVGTVSDIDAGVRLAFGRRMGPFETGDMVGLDVSFGALSAIYDATRERAFFPPQMLARKVKAGQLGRKTGAGWYRYDENGIKLED